MTLGVKATDNNKVQIKKILVTIDGSDYSFNAAKYAIKLAKDENAQLYCIHVIGSIHIWLWKFCTYNRPVL
jgi:nucleotide-binding universal stress UspA family protein